MQRILSILLTLVLGLGPCIAAVPVSALASGWTGKAEESLLPACCRRNGKHHCAMSAMASPDDREPAVSAPESCPYAPRALDSTAPTVSAVLDSTPHSLFSPAALLPSPALAATPQTADRRAWPQRGPPSSSLL